MLLAHDDEPVKMVEEVVLQMCTSSEATFAAAVPAVRAFVKKHEGIALPPSSYRMPYALKRQGYAGVTPVPTHVLRDPSPVCGIGAGNAAVRQEAWNEAIQCYSDAIELVGPTGPQAHTYYSNRSMCNERLGDWAAVRDNNVHSAAAWGVHMQFICSAYAHTVDFADGVDVTERGRCSSHYCRQSHIREGIYPLDQGNEGRQSVPGRGHWQHDRCRQGSSGERALLDEAALGHVSLSGAALKSSRVIRYSVQRIIAWRVLA